MKIHNYYLASIFLMLAGTINGMGRNWIPIPLRSGNTMWKATDRDNLIVIHVNSVTSERCGKIINYNEKIPERALSLGEIADYLNEAESKRTPDKVNLRDL